MVSPRPDRCLTWAPLTVTLQVTSRPTLTMATLAEFLAGAYRLTCLLQGSATLNSVCMMPPVST